MKDLVLYYLQILLPLPLLYLVAKSDNAWIFVILLFVYALAYRPLVDGYRLYNKGVIKKSDIKKSFYTSFSWDIKYFKELYLK